MTWTTRQRYKSGRLAAITAGEGPAILLLHGVGLRAEAWNRQIDALSDRYRVIAPDMPGHGESDPAAPEMQLCDYTDAALSLTCDPMVVVGHSMGAMIALDMATRFPDRVRGVAALNAIWNRDQTARAAVLARASNLDGKTRSDPTTTLDRWFGAALSAERSACDQWLRDVSPAGYKAAYSVFAQCDGPDAAALADLSCPALFMTGAKEPNSTPGMSRAMSEAAPKGYAIIVEGAAHMMPMTHPETVADALSALARRTLT